MSPAEVAWRAQDRVRRELWARRRFGAAALPAPRLRPPSPLSRSPAPRMAPIDLRTVPEPARRSLLAAADELCQGRAMFLGLVRDDMDDPNWMLDPSSGEPYPGDAPAHRIDYRAPSDPRSVKQVWELSRHQHVCVLAVAWRLTGDERYAALAGRHLRSWWAGNPPGRGVNWSSGIELGVRLISWIWTRRLLDGWPEAPALFEESETARRQIYWHQRWLAAFESRGSSANNHLVAEAAGSLAAASAFPWFAETDRWRARAARLLERALERNTFDCGLNREQAFEYLGFVCEVALAAGVECEVARVPLGSSVWPLVCRMVDAVAAVLDRAGSPPRYGDGDGGRGLLLDAPSTDRFRSLLSVGAALFGSQPWWPDVAPTFQSVLVSSQLGARNGAPWRSVIDGRLPERPSHFPGAGLTILRSLAPAPAAEGSNGSTDSTDRTGSNDRDGIDGSDGIDGNGGIGAPLEELWCSCDGGPHGFLSIAAHAHADALAVEVRHDGVELLADPGTYCYHGAPEWRRYFRSTIAHNTLEVGEEDQSVAGGPFLWTRHARTTVLDVSLPRDGPQRWSAEHDGYSRARPPVRHRRVVELDPAARTVRITDRLESARAHPVRLAFHLGPALVVALRGSSTERSGTLTWEHPGGGEATATILLPSELEWQSYRGSTSPLLGWYSAGFGRKEPATTLVGAGVLSTAVLDTELRIQGRRRRRCAG